MLGATLFLSSAAVVSAFQVGQTVNTDTGLAISGKASNWQPEVSEYLGIPYAIPPIDSLRWQAPVKYNASSTIPALKYSVDCPANVPKLNTKAELLTSKGLALASLGQFGDNYGEDCLTLNVWTKPQVGEEKKAVMAWIYGGGFAFGNSANPLYNGAKLANDQDVVVVSMNYRTNIFGFPGMPGAKDKNLGLMDQRMAIEWIRDNIAAFGGDPKRITIFGQSAGGVSVDYYSYAYTEDPIVNAFIPMSGTYELGQSIGLVGEVNPRWYKASKKAGCGGEEAGQATIACMQKKPWKDILRATRAQGIAVAFGGMGDFQPVVDEKLVFSDYAARAKAGKFINRPMLVGNTGSEITLFMTVGGLDSPALRGSFITKVGNSIFDCESGNAAGARVAQGVPAWRYRYNAYWPNIDLGANAGAFHAADIPMVFGTTTYVQKYFSEISSQSINFADTQAETLTINTMMQAWATFAKDPEQGLTKLGYPTYDANKQTILAIGDADKTSLKLITPSDVDSCGLVPSLIASMANGKLASTAELLGSISGPGSLLSSFLPQISVADAVARVAELLR